MGTGNTQQVDASFPVACGMENKCWWNSEFISTDQIKQTERI